MLWQCKGCCVKLDGSPGPCAGDVSKCGGCTPPPPALIIDNYLLVLTIIALIYGIWVSYKTKR